MYARDDYQHHGNRSEGRGRQHYRGHRGHRGRHRGYSDHRRYRRGAEGTGHNQEAEGYQDDSSGAPREGNRPPKGLSGRAIGMWYASRSRGKKAQREKQERSEVTMENAMERHLTEMIAEMRRRRAYAPPVKEETFEVDTDIPYEESADFAELGDPDKEYLMQASKSGDTAQQGSSDHACSDANLMMTEEYEYSKMNPHYRKMMEFRQKLPCYKERQNILDLVNHNQVVVLSGETGCGKTTQVPQYILDDFLEQERGSECHIVCTQPRRISAISVAERVADERAEKCGLSVGYMIRLENKLPRETGSILYCTTGIVLKMLEGDQHLRKATHIILDEIHERDLLSDFLIIILRDLIQKRPDLKVILMSATLNAEQFSQYYGSCPMIHIPGFTYPVTEYLLEDVIETLRYSVPAHMEKKAPRRRYRPTEEELEQEQAMSVWLRNMEAEKKYSRSTLEALEMLDTKKVDTTLIHQLIRHISETKPDGAILVFVPGWTDISDLHKAISQDNFFTPSKYKIIPLHSMMPTVNQRDVFQRPPPGVRKIVIATNIAETSITIDDVVYVIDGGKIKVSYFTPENNLMSLEPRLVSKANSKQRRGRAGRVQPGECYHLYSSLQESFMEAYLPPEILRTRLEELCLNIKLLKLGDIVPFVSKAMQCPSIEAMKSAIENLQILNALDKDENLLPLGKHLARLPLDPHTGKMMLFGAMFGCLDPISTIAAALNFKDPFYLPLGKEKEADRAKEALADGCNSDHILLVKAYQAWEEACQNRRGRQFCYEYFLSESTLWMLKKMKGQLEQYLKDLGFVTGTTSMAAANANSDNMALVKAVVCAGLYPNVAKIPNKKFVKLHTKSERCDLHPKSVAAKTRPRQGVLWTVYHQKMKTTGLYIYDCSIISPYALMLFGGEMTHVEEDGESLVCIDDWIKFKASPATIQLFKDIRQEVDIILDRKISRAYQTLWNPESREHALVDAVIDLITTEDYYPEGQPQYEEHHQDNRSRYRPNYR